MAPDTTVHNSHVCPHKFAFILDNWIRRLIQNPGKILAGYISPGDIVVDVGCGPGFFTLPLAKAVQTVYATDISNEMLNICRSRAAENNVNNIEFVQSDSINLDIDSNIVDAILLANVYHEFSSNRAILKELHRILKSSGKLFVIDWHRIEMESGPPLEHRLSDKTVIQNFEFADFSFRQAHNIYKQNYVLEFNKD